MWKFGLREPGWHFGIWPKADRKWKLMISRRLFYLWEKFYGHRIQWDFMKGLTGNIYREI